MVVKGPYSPEDWLTMKMYKFQCLPHLIKQNIKHHGRYKSRIEMETEKYKEYLQKEAA